MVVVNGYRLTACVGSPKPKISKKSGNRDWHRGTDTQRQRHRDDARCAQVGEDHVVGTRSARLIKARGVGMVTEILALPGLGSE